MVKHNGITTYLRLFKGREDYLAQQGEDRYFPINASLDPFYVARHLDGDATFGLYVLTSQNMCHLVCVDVDIPKAQLDELDFADRSAKYERLSPLLQGILQTIEGDLGIPSDSVLLEETGGRGYHIWILLAAPVAGDTAVAFGRALKSRLNIDFEFFPKQGALGPNRKYGNLIKLPLGIHQRYGLRSVFFTVDDGGPRYLESQEDNLAFLNHVTPLDPEVLARAAKGYQTELVLDDDRYGGVQADEAKRTGFEGSVTHLLTNCAAMRLIREKAHAGQKLSHSEAFHFANVMLSLPEGEEYVQETMNASFGEQYDEQRTRDEIARIRRLLPTSCRTLVDQHFCPGYCKQSVAKRNQDPLVSNTSPCSVWSRRARVQANALTGDAVEAMAKPENIERAFFQLKQYHEHEDSLFYDPFDFELFEARLSSRSQVIAQAFREKMAIPLAGYLPVNIPKKLDDNLNMQFRQMSYSTVYDQVPIQTVFNVIAPNIESILQPCSYGYRWNLDLQEPSRIFEDWRDAYPRFRNKIMSAIQRNTMGYHICCDIKGYYDQVKHNILLEQLRMVALDDYVYSFVEQVIRGYEAESGKGKGLPQGPAYARLLANLYLNDFDCAAQEITAAYFRYVDDFFLVFDSYESAERGLERVVVALRALGLELSDDETKRAVIEPNTELANIRRTLDKIKYGILEGTRQIQHLDPETVSDFYSAVERHSGSPADSEQLVKINDSLPSLLYSVSQETLIPHDFRVKLLDISRLLIRRGWFCPKRLKIIFYRLLDIEPEKEQFIGLFDEMLPAHRVYFLLSVFGCWRSRSEHDDLLKSLLAKACKDEDPFVWGFAIAISAEVEANQVSERCKAFGVAKLSPDAGWFRLARFLGSCDYALLSSEQRAALRRLVREKSPDFLKAVMFSNIRSFPSDYLDGTYMRGLLREFRFLLMPEVARLLAVAMDRTQLFDTIVSFMVSMPSFKALSVTLVEQAIREERASAGQADINNLQSLYENVTDTELRNVMKAVLASIHSYALDPGAELFETHRSLDNYNGCYLLETIEPNCDYRFLEFIPEDKMRESVKCDFNNTERILADLASKGVLLPHEFSYDSGKREVTIRSAPWSGKLQLIQGTFTLDPASIGEALRIATDTFKKALYFRRKTRKVPLVSLQNLLIDRTSGTVVFHTIGRSMTTPFTISGITIGEEKADISRMIALLLQQLFFTTDADARKFLDKKHHLPASAFLAHVISNMSSKEPSHRYAFPRLQYLEGAFTHCQATSDEELGVLYLLERLKAGLFRHNPELITWQGACSTLNGHVSDIRVLFDNQSLADVPLQNRTTGIRLIKGRLHWLSLQMLNLSMNRHRIKILNKADPYYLDLVEYLLLYGVVCVETVALCRSSWGKRILDVKKYHTLLNKEEVSVSASGYEQKVPSLDFAALFTYRSDGTGEDVKDLSLRQVALLALLACGGEVGLGEVHISKPHGLPKKRFDDLAHACLCRIPRFETEAHKCFEVVSSALRAGDDLKLDINIDCVQKTVIEIVRDFTRIRKHMKLKRYTGWSDGKKCPEKIVCKTRFRKPAVAKVEAIPEMALVNTFPSSKYHCSWDMSHNVVTNLVVASSGFYSFLMDLRRGKLFGHKLSYLYTGRSMLLWDSLLLIGNLLVMTLAKCGEDGFQHNFLKSGCATASKLFNTFAALIVIKIFYDLRHWIPPLKSIIAHVRKVRQLDKEI